MVRTGEVLPDDLLRKEGMEKWVKAGSIPKLFKQIGSAQRTRPSPWLLLLAGVLAVMAIVASPLSDLTSNLEGLSFLGSVAFSGACLVGSTVFLITAIIGKEKQPMVVPTEGRLLKESGADTQPLTAGSRTPQQQASDAGAHGVAVAGPNAEPNHATSVVRQVYHVTLASWIPNIAGHGGQVNPNAAAIRVVIGLLAMVVVGFGVSRWLSRVPRQHLLSGEVTFRGTPVPVGFIRFTPTTQSKLAKPILSGEISKGRYMFRSGHGSDGGTYVVQISGFTGVPKQVGVIADPLGDEMFPRLTRTVELPCSDHTLNVNCDSD